MELVQDKNSRKGLIGTILFHLLLLLLFLQFGMTYQDPPPPNPGVMRINFGDAGGGSPSEENSEASESASSSSNNSESTESSSASADENVQTTTNETVEMNASPNNSNNETTETQETSEPLNEALNNAWNNNNSNNESSTSDSNGDNNSNNSNGNGNTNGNSNGPSSGINYSLGGRGKVSFKKPNNPTQEDGTVVVDIVVDKYGKVIKATPGARGSTTTNPTLYKQAKEAALKAKFTKKLDALTDQKGTMTFVFILN